MGDLCGWCRGRSAIHASSFHVYVLAVTTDAVCGGRSAYFAMGSAFWRQRPSLPRISYLYAVPLPMPGTNSSHTPETPSERIECVAPCHMLKSPTIRMARALGAQTAK